MLLEVIIIDSHSNTILYNLFRFTKMQNLQVVVITQLCDDINTHIDINNVGLIFFV